MSASAEEVASVAKQLEKEILEMSPEEVAQAGGDECNSDEDLEALKADRDALRDQLSRSNKRAEAAGLRHEIQQLKEANKAAEASAGSAQKKEDGDKLNFLRQSRPAVSHRHGGAVGTVNELEGTKLASKSNPFTVNRPRDHSASSAGSDDSLFSLTSRDSKRGKPGKQSNQSGIKEGFIETVLNRQKYPQAELQYEHLWGRSGDKVEYFDLTFGLFVAGELEVILGGHMHDMNEVHRRLHLLRITAYRSQYIEWSKLLHLHAAIMRKIETGVLRGHLLLMLSKKWFWKIQGA